MTLVWLVRIGIVVLGIVSALFIFAPEAFLPVATAVPGMAAFERMLQSHPGFDSSWRSIAGLIHLSAYVYGYLIVVLLFWNLLQPPDPSLFRDAQGRYRWHLMSIAMVGAESNVRPSSSGADADRFFAVVREYSMSREGIGFLSYRAVGLAAVSYILYSGLQRPPSGSSPTVFARAIDALLVGFWAYCVFSIVFWFLLAVTGWLHGLGHRSIKRG